MLDENNAKIDNNAQWFGQAPAPHAGVESASFLNGGVPSGSPLTRGSLCSTLRFVPAKESGVGDSDDLIPLRLVFADDFGGVARITSGVADRDLEAKSLRNRAASVLVEESASA